MQFTKHNIAAINFSPHAPFGTLLAAASGSSISLLDTRQLESSGASSTSIIWKIPDAHISKVTDVQFNNFVPYWLASGGEDGVVKMWDIRYMKSFAVRIDAHYSAVSSIAWSNTHCDIISSGGYDRSCKTWAINSAVSTAKVPWKEHMIGCPGSEFENGTVDGVPQENLAIGARLISTCTSLKSPVVKAHADTFLSVTALGTITSHTFHSRVLDTQLTHRYENAYEKEVETSVQNRHLSDAYETMIRLSRHEFPKDEGIAKDESELIKVCTSRPDIEPDSWKVGEYVDSCKVGLVRHELQDLSYGLPPGFARYHQWLCVSDFVKLQFSLVLLRHDILTKVEAGDWQVLVENEKQIMNGMGVDEEFLDLDSIELIVQTLLQNKYLKGMQMGLAFGQLLADVPKFKFETFADVLHLLLFPTVYETQGWVPDDEIDPLKENSVARQEKISKYLFECQSERESSMPALPVASHGRGASIATVLKVKRSSKVSSRLSPNRGSPKRDDPSKKLLRSVLGEAKRALPMVSLELKLLKLIESPSDEVNEQIISIMQNVLADSGAGGSRTKAGVIPFERTVSALTNRLYLDALFDSKRYEEFYGVAISLMSAYNPFPFSAWVLKECEIGFNSVRDYVKSMLNTATTTINAVLTAQAAGSAINTQGLVSAVKLLKDAIVMIVKITAHLMDGLELLKADKETTDAISRILTNVTALMLQSSAALLRAFEHFSRIQKVMSQEFAHTTHDALRDATRNLPLSVNKSRPINVAEKAALGLTIQEEAFSVLEKLYKTHWKQETAQN